MIYTNTNWWNPCTGSNHAAFGSYPPFLSGYTASPAAAGRMDQVDFPAVLRLWNLPGDQDVFNGDQMSLTLLTGTAPVSLRAHANGKYVPAEDAGRSPLIANRTAIGRWEEFRPVANSDGSISLLANANRRYVTADSAGSSPLIANATAIGAWQKFYRTPS
jgi:hypothetical protein